MIRFLMFRVYERVYSLSARKIIYLKLLSLSLSFLLGKAQVSRERIPEYNDAHDGTRYVL